MRRRKFDPPVRKTVVNAEWLRRSPTMPWAKWVQVGRAVKERRVRHDNWTVISQIIMEVRNGTR